MAPEPSGFTDLFAPNTSSIMSVASSTPGHADRNGGAFGIGSVVAGTTTVPPSAPSSALVPGKSGSASGGGVDGGGVVRTRRSGGVGRGEDAVGRGGGLMPPPVPRGGSGSGVEEEGTGSADVDGGEDFGGVSSPQGLRLGVVGDEREVCVSTGKRKRERRDEGLEEEKERLWADLGTERTRWEVMGIRQEYKLGLRNVRGMSAFGAISQ